MSTETAIVPVVNYSRIPNDLIDVWMPVLPAAEFLILMCIARYTFGFHRKDVEMGMRLISQRTGIHIQTVSPAVRALEARGAIVICRSGLRGRITYQICLDAKPSDCSENQNSAPHPECSENQNSHCSENQNTTVLKIRTRERKSLKETLEIKPRERRASESRGVVEPPERPARPPDDSENLKPGKPADVPPSPEAQQHKAPDPVQAENTEANAEQEAIAAELRERHIKIEPPGIVAELLALAEERGVNGKGLALFIEYKCQQRSIEIASFFRKAIAEDLPRWKAKHAERLDRSGGLVGVERRPNPRLQHPGEIGPMKAATHEDFSAAELDSLPIAPAAPCPVCRDRGYRVDRHGERDVSVDWCTCPASQREIAARGESWAESETSERRARVLAEIEAGERAMRELEKKIAAAEPNFANFTRARGTLQCVPPKPKAITQADIDRVLGERLGRLTSAVA